MKSKRKQINKFKEKQDNRQSQYYQDGMKRSSGFKPFHLHKVRHPKRGSMELPNYQDGESTVYQNNAIQTKMAEKNDMYLDIIIKKKLLIDGQFNQRLMSQRKSIVYLDNQKKLKNEPEEETQERDNDELIDFNSQLLQTQDKNQPQNNEKSIKSNHVNFSKKKRNKCQCCLQLDDFTSQAIICKNSLTNKMVSGEQYQRSNSQKTETVQMIDPKQQLKLITDRALKSPFSFTNVKWRSKSQILQVDKWKEKYGRSSNTQQNYSPINKNKSKSTAKIMKYEREQSNQIHNKIKKKISAKNEIKQNNFNGIVLPSINRQEKQISNPEKTGDSNIKQNFLLQIEERQNIQKQIPLFEQSKQSGILLRSQEKSNTSRQYLYSDLLKKQNEIVIKEMFTKNKNVSKDQMKLPQKLVLLERQLQKNDRQAVQTKVIKKKKSKSKFPEITVTKFYSTMQTMQNEEEKKRSKYLQLQKLTNSWKQKPPKKIFLEKMMEQIPERWEYGQSRDNSREIIQVDYYVKFKREQQIIKKMQNEVQQKKLKESNQNLLQPKAKQIEGKKQNEEQILKVTNN